MGRKKRLVLIVAIILCVNILVINASATNLIEAEAKPSGGMQILWVNVNSLTCLLTINGTNASCVAEVVGVAGTTQINSRLTLYKYIGGAWQYMASWVKNESSSQVSYSENYTVQSGYYYKLYITADVYSNGGWESVSKTSALCYCS